MEFHDNSADGATGSPPPPYVTTQDSKSRPDQASRPGSDHHNDPYPLGQEYGYDQPSARPYTGQQMQPISGGRATHSSNTVVVMTQPVVSYNPHALRTFTGQFVYSCFVFWCCGWLAGGIAFILAIVAGDKEQSGKREEATTYGRASYVVSIIGTLTGIAIITYLCISLTRTSTDSSHNPYINDLYNTKYSG